MPAPLTADELAEYGIPPSRNGHARKPRTEADTPPHDADAERSVIGSILIDPSHLDSLAERLRPCDFHLPAASRVWQEFLAMRRDGVPVDSTLLVSRLTDCRAIDKDVSLVDIVEMADSVPTAANAAWYADTVAKLAERRRAWMLADRLKALAHQGHRGDQEYQAWRAEIEAVPTVVFRDGADSGGIDHGWMSCADFMAQDVRQTWLCEGVVPEAQGGIISGRFKTLKTSIACDLFWSMATGTPFLGTFAVPAPVPCALMTGESGPAAIISTMRRIAAAKGGDYRDGPYLTTTLARMTDPRHLDQLERDIDRHGWRCVAIDPTYLAFCDVGQFAGNVFLMGKATEPLTALMKRTGCSLILLNHNTKNRPKDIGRHDPPDLAEISQSGWAEWMRFWLLLGQMQEWDEVGGTHWLWVRTGGGGYSNLHALTASEGQHDAKGRRTKWETVLQPVGDIQRQKENRAANKKAEQQERKEQEHARKLMDALKVCTDFESARKLRELSGLSGKDFGTAIRSLLKAGKVEQSSIEKRGQVCDGYKLKDKAGQAGQGGTEGGTVPPSD